MKRNGKSGLTVALRTAAMIESSLYGTHLAHRLDIAMNNKPVHEIASAGGIGQRPIEQIAAPRQPASNTEVAASFGSSFKRQR
jgi:hypothetical protein